MPVTDARTAPVHDVAGTRFTPLAAPSSGSTEICVWRVELPPHADPVPHELTREEVLVVLSGTLTAFGLPLEGVAVILGVDELMDMARTMVNLVGNCLATAVMARWEGELGQETPAAGVQPSHATVPAARSDT